MSRRLHGRVLLYAPLAVSVACAAGAFGLASRGAAQGPTRQWEKADMHVHSIYSADAFPDLALIARFARSAGYNAIFLSDHNLASNFPINGVSANSLTYSEGTATTAKRWYTGVAGSPSSQIEDLSSSAPVHGGTTALRLVAAGPGEAHVSSKRGPDLLPTTGTITMSFAVDPASLAPGAGFYASVSLGGDVTTANDTDSSGQTVGNDPVGYTNLAGQTVPCKSTVIAWYYGAPPPAAQYAPSGPFCPGNPADQAPYPAGTLVALDLAQPGNGQSCSGGFAPGAWTTCTIDVSSVLATKLQAADRPAPDEALIDPKLAVVGNGASADVSFDDYALTDQATPPAGDPGVATAAAEFVDRNVRLPAFDAPGFTIFPSIEYGTNEHAHRLNFGIGDPSQFAYFPNGVDGIASIQATGYPAQLNHPGVPGGVSDDQAVGNTPCSGTTAVPACGADEMEVRFANMLADWDELLTRGTLVLGTWSNDDHVARWTARSEAVYIDSPSLGFDDMVHSLWEGRFYDASSFFGGRASFNLDPASSDPYPARYPTYVSPATADMLVHLKITPAADPTNVTTQGLDPTDVVRWITDVPAGPMAAGISSGAQLAADVVGGTSTNQPYEQTRAVPLDHARGSTYVRAEVVDATGTPRLETQPIVFRDVAGLPAGMSVHVDEARTPDNRGYTVAVTQTISATPTWIAARQTLQFPLTDRPGTALDVSVATAGRTPARVSLDGACIPDAAGLEGGSAPSSYTYDPSAQVVHLTVGQTAPTDTVQVVFDASVPCDADAPSAPAKLQALAGGRHVRLTWAASVDNVGVARYEVLRGGKVVGRAGAGATPSFTDAGLQLHSAYVYAVRAVDAQGNVSPASSPLRVKTTGMPRVAILGGRAVVRHHVVALRFRCPSGTAGGCRVQIALRASHTTLATSTNRIRAGRTRTLRLFVFRKARHVLAGRTQLAAVVRATSGNAVGDWITTSRRITLEVG